MKKQTIAMLILSTCLSVNAMAANKPSAKMLNVNTATVAQLTSLPHIGEKIAQRIVKYRQKNGDFKSLADLSNVRGISASRVKDIKGLATAS